VIDISEIPTRDVFEPNTIRLIGTAYIDEPAMAPLANSEAELEFLAEIEGLTSKGLGSDIPIPSDLDPTELLTERAGFGWTYVNAAFCHTRPTGNRFNGPERGAWYATMGIDAVHTAHAEVAWHLGRELEATGIFENVTSYRELVAGFITRLHDISEFPDQDFLDPDINIGYPAGQALAQALRHRDSNGLAYPSVRRIGGVCLAIFRPHLVQNIRPGKTWVFRWDGQPVPTIEQGR
jgi:hypothetical protein